MKDIKFRAWDTYNKAWVPGSDNFVKGFFILPNGYVQIVGASEFISYAESLKQERYVLCQYTGLKDKNAKECYEGDIIKWCTFIADVKFIDGWKLSPFIFNDVFDFEIIGNIYEHPHLLEDKQNGS